ncbi:MAG: prepilin-type N-terminal cleavage/methylation domain-containing protein [Acidobacteria bacterium]|nr:prepilin-type N-terminal cleavage/methylation domain-containing protein [Acidobacteriota bacterium]
MNKKISELMKKDEGFSLIEVIIGMGIFAIAILSIIQIFYFSVSLNRRSKQLVESASIAKQAMDSFRLLTFKEIDEYDPTGTQNVDLNEDSNIDYIYNWNIEKEALSTGTDYWKYTVTITVNPKGRAVGSAVGVGMNAYSLRSIIVRNPNTI